MENTSENKNLLEKALQSMVDDMKIREIGAIIWSVADAGFHYIPEILIVDSHDGKQRTARITGLYRYNGKLYAIEEDTAGVSVDQFYRHGIDVPPVVVTLSETKASDILGEPTEKRGYTTQGTVQEWVAIADCYFEALNER